MKKINVEGGGFPGTSKTWRFIAEMIGQTADVTTALAGNNTIVSGLQSGGISTVTDGLIVINGELYAVQGSNAVGFGDAYIALDETIEQTQYLKDEDADGSGDLVDTYFERFGVVTDVAEGNIKLSDFVRLSNLAQLSRRIPPVQTALPYFGGIDSVPLGWQLCDGTNGTPDLRGKFVVGYDPADTDYDAVGKAGGKKEHVLTEAEMPQHSHGGTAQTAGSHTHGLSQIKENTNNSFKNGFYDRSLGGPSTSLRTDSGGSHSHNLSINNAGQSQPHENRPPYYTLAYIAYIGV